MYQHPARQVNISRKAVSCAPDSCNFFETPYNRTMSYVIVSLLRNYRCWLFATWPAGITDGDSNLPIQDLSTLVATIIFLRVKFN